MWNWARLRQQLHRHRHLQRVTVGSVRYFRCRCGYQVPQIDRAEPRPLLMAHEQLRAVRAATSGAPATAAGIPPPPPAPGGE
jgi:hypothetical protein